MVGLLLADKCKIVKLSVLYIVCFLLFLLSLPSLYSFYTVLLVECAGSCSHHTPTQIIMVIPGVELVFQSNVPYPYS